MNDIDSEADALLKRWNAQQANINAMQPGANPMDGGGTDQSPHLTKEGFTPQSPDQTPEDPVNSVRPMDHTLKQAPPTMPSAGMSVNTNSGGGGGVPGSGATGGVCSQCGTMHPPVQPGQKCPLKAVADDPSKTGGLDDVIVNKHLVDMRNIIMAHVSSKGIKDGKKLFQHCVIELTKTLEAYNE